jgi:glycosyltransferase involved in cell wall biosynthesis
LPGLFAFAGESQLSPEVSVIVPLYNKERHVERAIRSVLAQSRADIELVVVDDGSTDDGARIVAAIRDPRIRLVTQANSGVSAARNRGIGESHADLIAFLDADDEWKPDFLATIIRLRERFPNCGAYATAHETVDRDGRRNSIRLAGIPGPPWEGIIHNYFRSSIESANNIVSSSTVAIPKTVLDHVGHFPVGVVYGEDADMWCRIALRYPIAFSSLPGALYHEDAGGRACERPMPLVFDEVIRSLEAALKSGVPPPGIPMDDVVEYKNWRHICSARVYIAAGLRSKARTHFRAASSTRRFRKEWRSRYVRSLVPLPLMNCARRVKRFVFRDHGAACLRETAQYGATESTSERERPRRVEDDQ